MNVAFIPVRGGSKSVPLKNIKEMNGWPLVYWTIKAACESQYIEKVYVATDSKAIKETIDAFKKCIIRGSECIFVIDRSVESATDTASTEFAMIEFANQYEFDNIVLIQATSPLLVASDLDKGFEVFLEENVDSVLSGVRQKRFIWNRDQDGFVSPHNYDFYHRPRRQEFDGYLVENGAFYITSKKRLLETKNRISGNIKMIEMDEASFYEIDEPSDWVIVEQLLRNREQSKCKTKEKNIRILLSDCDGCLTDGGMYYSENGDELKKFNTKDAVGFSLLREKGIITGVITGEDRKLNSRRVKKMKLEILVQGCKDKLEVMQQICEQYHVGMDNIAYIGDDLNDLEVLKHVGLSCCPNDAVNEIKQISMYIAKCKGGKGVVREVAQYILEQYINE